MAQKWTRRQFDAALAARRCSSRSGLAAGSRGQRPVVVGTWGGDYQNLMQKTSPTRC